MKNSELKLVHALEPAHVVQLCALYREEWWTLRREPPQVTKMLAHSDMVVGLLDRRDKLVGFTRVLSDFTFKALILDVIVSMDWRGRGLGKLLMDTVMDAPALADVTHFELYCLPEMESYYRRWGFRRDGELHFLRAERRPG